MLTINILFDNEILAIMRALVDPAIYSDGKYCFFCSAPVSGKSKSVGRHCDDCPHRMAKTWFIRRAVDINMLRSNYVCQDCHHQARAHLDERYGCVIEGCKCNLFITEQVATIRNLMDKAFEYRENDI